MNDKQHLETAIITGGTTGIGLHLSIGLARAGYRVVMLGRREDHARSALAAVQEQVPEAQAGYKLADLADLRQVEQLGRELRAEIDSVRILMNNAGAFFLTRQTSSQGIEKTFAINHVGHFYLTHFLLERVQSAADGRIVMTSSGAHRGPRDRDLDWQMDRSYTGWRAYGLSKLANILFTDELARRFANERLTVNSYHPGFVQTQLATRNPLLRPFVWLAYLFLGGTAQEGADTGLYLALDESVRGRSGAYWVDRQPVQPSRLAGDRQLARELWELSLDLTGIREFGKVE